MTHEEPTREGKVTVPQQAVSHEYEQVAEAAARLGISDRRVRQLIEAGELDAARVGRAWFVSRESIDRRMELSPSGGRPWSPEVAWAVSSRLDNSGRLRSWHELGGQGVEQQLERVVEEFYRGGCLRDLAALFRRRAQKHRFYAHPAALKALEKDPSVVRSGASAAVEYDLDILPVGQFEAYVPAEELEAIVLRFHLKERGQGLSSVILRAVESPWPFAPHSPVAPEVAVALDLLESEDPRYRKAGNELAERLRKASLEDVDG